MKVQSLLLGFIIGGVAAGVVTLLSAPASGKETRKNLSNHKEIWEENILQLKESLMELKDSISVVSKEGKDETLAFVQDIKVLVDSWKRDILPYQERIRNELDAMQSTIQELEEALNLPKE